MHSASQPSRVSLSAGRRYVALKGEPKKLALYELETIEVLRTSAFLGEARRGIGRHDRCNYLINGHHQIFPMHTNRTQGSAPFLQMGRIDVPSVVEDAPRCRIVRSELRLPDVTQKPQCPVAKLLQS